MKDLIAARLEAGGQIVFEAGRSSIHDFTSDRRASVFSMTASLHELACDFIGGCDGFHGVCRASIPASALRCYEKVYPFAWLGILAGPRRRP